MYELYPSVVVCLSIQINKLLKSNLWSILFVKEQLLFIIINYSFIRTILSLNLGFLFKDLNIRVIVENKDK